MSLTLLLFIVFFICVAMLWNEGLWNNAVTLINMTLAGLVATNYFEPLAAWVDGQLPTYTYLWDFLMFWALFAAVFGGMRTVTDLLSKKRVEFKMPVEHTGRVLLAIWVGWLMVCLVCFSIHLAPLPPNPMNAFKTPTSSTFMFLTPDRQWAGFAQQVSRGSLRRSDKMAKSPYDADQGKRVFDPKAELFIKYHARRARFAEQPEYRVHRNGGGGQ